MERVRERGNSQVSTLYRISMFLLVFLTGLEFVFGAQLYGYSASPVNSLENEIFEVLQEATQAFHPDKNSLDTRTKDFESQTLAFLYISAVREQMKALGVNIHSETISYAQKLKHHNAWHIFNNKEHELFAIKKWIRALLVLYPDPNLSLENEISKIESFGQLEALRSQLLRQMLSDGSEESKKVLAEKMKETIQNLPGNSQNERFKYLKAVAERPEYNSDIKSLYEAMLYNVRFSEVVFKETESKSYADATMFFRMLDSYFSKLNADRKFILWTKFLPKYQYLSPLPQQAFLRFYISEKDIFVNQVFENEIPIQIISSYRGLFKHKNGIQNADVVRALNSILSFLEKHKNLLTEKARQRIIQSYGLVQAWSKQQTNVPSNDLTFEKFAPISGDLKLKVDNGPTLLTDTVFAAHDVDSADLGISYFKFDGDDFHVRIEKDAQHGLNISARQDWGLLWMKSRLDNNVTALDYESFAYEDRKNGALGVRFLNGEPTVSTLVLPLTLQGQQAFDEVSLQEQFLNRLQK